MEYLNLYTITLSTAQIFLIVYIKKNYEHSKKTQFNLSW